MARLSNQTGHRIVPGAALDLALLLIITIIFFWPVLSTNQYIFPYDILDHHYPFRYFIAESLKSGELPLWSPYLFSGYPGLGDPEWGIFYPPNLIISFLSPGEGLSYQLFEWQAIFHHFLAGISMYILARYLFGHRLGSLIAAVVYMFGGFFVTHTSLVTHINVLAWLPLIFLCFHIALKKKSFSWALLAGVFFGLATLAGYVNSILHVGYMLLAYLGYRLYRPLLDRRIGEALHLVGLFVFVGLVTGGLAAISLLPAQELGALSIRAGQSFEEAGVSSMAPVTLITLFLPNFFSYQNQTFFWAPNDLAEAYNYLGILPLLLALIAVLRVRRKGILALAAFAVFSLFAAFGIWTFFQQFSFYFLPGFDKIRRPFNAIIFFEFGVALLAAAGAKYVFSGSIDEAKDVVDKLVRGTLRFAPVLVTAGLAALLGLAYTTDALHERFAAIANGFVLLVILLVISFAILILYTRKLFDARLLSVLALLLVVFDIFSFGASKPFNMKRLDVANIGPKTAYDGSGYELLSYLKSDQDYQKGDFYRVEARAISWLWRNTPTIWRIADTNGGSNLQLLDYASFRAQILDYNSRLLDFLGVKYFVTQKPLKEVDPKVDMDKVEQVMDGYWKLYRRKEVLARAFVVYEAVTLPDKMKVLDVLRSSSFDPGKTVVFQEEVPRLEKPGGADRSNSQVNVTKYRNQRIDIRASLSRPGFLVTSEVYYPGWKALVDGTESKIYRANQSFRSLYLDAGEHEISFVYDPLSFRLGLWLTLLTTGGVVLVGIVIAILHVRRRGSSNVGT